MPKLHPGRRRCSPCEMSNGVERGVGRLESNTDEESRTTETKDSTMAILSLPPIEHGRDKDIIHTLAAPLLNPIKANDGHPREDNAQINLLRRAYQNCTTKDGSYGVVRPKRCCQYGFTTYAPGRYAIGKLLLSPYGKWTRVTKHQELAQFRSVTASTCVSRIYIPQISETLIPSNKEHVRHLGRSH
ncbi:hypothetical protein C8R44DRAFT_747200 [Mycena epipterygia]|nr:hypothetical protein C8R44DRAFT_747200 [Mycena epipterygia]